VNRADERRQRLMFANMFRGKRNISSQMEMSRGFVPPKQPEIIISPTSINNWDKFSEWTKKITKLSQMKLMETFVYSQVNRVQYQDSYNFYHENFPVEV
jgi:hypothetical protein